MSVFLNIPGLLGRKEETEEGVGSLHSVCVCLCVCSPIKPKASKVDRAYLSHLSLIHLPFSKLGLLVLSSLQIMEEGTIAATSTAQETSAAVVLAGPDQDHSLQSTMYSRGGQG